MPGSQRVDKPAGTRDATLRMLAGILRVPVMGVDAAGKVDIWNPAASGVFGWTEAELRGSVPPPELQPMLTARPQPGALSQIQVTGRDGRHIVVELRGGGRDDGGHVFIAVDTSQAESQEREKLDLLRRESRFRELLEAAPDAIIEVDRDGRIVLLNRVTEQLFGYTRDKLLGMSVDALIPHSMSGQHADHRARYWANPVTRPMGHGLTLRARRSDGHEFPVEISLSPVQSEGGLRVTAIIRDVTTQKEAEEAIKVANQQLELRTREAERANSLKSEFLASMSHELRTPLHTILGFTELLREETSGPLNDKQKRFVRHVHQDATHLLELINDILDLSKIEAGRLDLQIQSTDATALIHETVDSLRVSAAVKRIEIDVEMSPAVFVMADRVRFREIVTNLLSNAVKFTPEGGRIVVANSDVRQALNGSGMVEISVTDTGIGIAEADQKVIFDKFRQVASTTKGVREGTGLGLAIVERLVTMHGGSVSVTSRPGEGSRFAFTIPLDLGHERQEPLILIIEDSGSARELLCTYLNPLGIRTECAGSAEEGLLIAQRLRPDAIMLDLLLPGRTGWKALEDLRSMPQTKTVPVFVTSVLDFDRGAMARGATDYLQKPLTRDAVVRALKEHLPERFEYLTI